MTPLRRRELALKKNAKILNGRPSKYPIPSGWTLKKDYEGVACDETGMMRYLPGYTPEHLRSEPTTTYLIPPGWTAADNIGTGWGYDETGQIRTLPGFDPDKHYY